MKDSIGKSKNFKLTEFVLFLIVYLDGGVAIEAATSYIPPIEPIRCVHMLN